METFNIPSVEVPRPRSLREISSAIDTMIRRGYVVVLDEFQYFSRKVLFEFNSFLQAVVDRLNADASSVTGGLIVCGSLHTELVALLDDRDAPLYHRTTDNLELDHLDVPSVLSILRTHADADPYRVLFFWSLFEGVPKFYRDCFEQGVLKESRSEVLRKMFFQSSSPLKAEADTWFLHELRGRYDVVLKFVARNPGCTNGDIESHVSSLGPEKAEQAGGYLKILIERFRMIEKKQPIFLPSKARRSRYYIRDNFLRSWLGALSNPISAVNFRPLEVLLAQADTRLMEMEGHSLERLVRHLYERRSKRRIGDFPITNQIEGYWDRGDTEIDLVAIDEDSRRIRLGTCKRSAETLLSDVANFEGHVQRFMDAFTRFADWELSKVAIAPHLEAEQRAVLRGTGIVPQDLTDLLEGL
jgi:hypothetical protein